MKTIVLGATTKPDRFACRAMETLMAYGHRAVPVNPAFDDVLGQPCYARVANVPGPIDTITVYLGPLRSEPLIPEILAARPRRLILNPGAENENLATQAREAGIEVVEGCTLVMLQSGAF